MNAIKTAKRRASEFIRSLSGVDDPVPHPQTQALDEDDLDIICQRVSTVQ